MSCKRIRQRALHLPLPIWHLAKTAAAAAAVATTSTTRTTTAETGARAGEGEGAGKPQQQLENSAQTSTANCLHYADKLRAHFLQVFLKFLLFSILALTIVTPFYWSSRING